MMPTANRASAGQGSAAPAPSPRWGEGWGEGTTSPFAPTAFAARATAQFLPAPLRTRKLRIARDIALLALAVIAAAAANRANAQVEMPATRSDAPPELVVRVPECPEGTDCLKLTVDTDLLVGTDGAVKSCKIVKSDAPKPLEDKVCEIAARRWKFKPQIKDGQPAEFNFKPRFSFYLKELPPTAPAQAPQ